MSLDMSLKREKCVEAESDEALAKLLQNWFSQVVPKSLLEGVTK